jgi:hypothetical protein
LKNALAYFNAGVVVNSQVAGLAPKTALWFSPQSGQLYIKDPFTDCSL